MSTDAKPLISFGPEIRSFAASRGLTVTPEEVGKIDSSLNGITSIEGNAVSFKVGSDGRTVTLGEAVEIMSVGYGKITDPNDGAAPMVKFGWHPITNPSAPEPEPTYASTTERAVAMNAAIRAGSDGTKRSQAEALVRTYGNPWRTGNATHRAYITNTHPELAEELKMQAETR